MAEAFGITASFFIIDVSAPWPSVFPLEIKVEAHTGGEFHQDSKVRSQYMPKSPSSGSLNCKKSCHLWEYSSMNRVKKVPAFKLALGVWALLYTTTLFAQDL